MSDETKDVLIKIKTVNSNSNIKAIVQVRFEQGLWVKGFRIMLNPRSDLLFVDAPALMDADGKYRKMFWDENIDRWHALQEAILTEYETHINNN